MSDNTTPRPWRKEREPYPPSDPLEGWRIATDDKVIADLESWDEVQQNGDLIVRAVNDYEALVAIAEAAERVYVLELEEPSEQVDAEAHAEWYGKATAAYGALVEVVAVWRERKEQR